MIKLALAALLPMTSDEAYYWVWSLHPQLSYYDHPSMVAWLFWLGQGTDFYGGMIRWPSVLLGHVTLAIWLRILAPFLSDAQRKAWLLLALLSPLIGGSSLLVTPDLPVMFFYALALYLLLQWEKQPTAVLAMAFGLSMGFGFSSKYMMVLFPLSALPWLFFERGLLKKTIRHLHWIVLGAIIGAMPVWLWNLQNDLVSLRFQVDHGLGRKWKPSWTVHYIGAQIGLIFPLILYWATRARRQVPVLFHFLAWTPLIFFFFTTFRGYVEANWPIVAYAPLFVLAVVSMPRNRSAVHLTAIIWGTIITALAAIIIIKPGWSRTTKFREFHQFDQVIEATRDLTPVYARSYQMAAKMHFELRRPIYKLKGMNRKDFYDYLPESAPTAKRYYFVAEKGDKLPLEYSANGHKVIDKQDIDGKFQIWTVNAP